LEPFLPDRPDDGLGCGRRSFHRRPAASVVAFRSLRQSWDGGWCWWTGPAATGPSRIPLLLDRYRARGTGRVRRMRRMDDRRPLPPPVATLRLVMAARPALHRSAVLLLLRRRIRRLRPRVRRWGRNRHTRPIRKRTRRQRRWPLRLLRLLAVRRPLPVADPLGLFVRTAGDRAAHPLNMGVPRRRPFWSLLLNRRTVARRRSGHRLPFRTVRRRRLPF
jgi:hypothetical protein